MNARSSSVMTACTRARTAAARSGGYGSVPTWKYILILGSVPDGRSVTVAERRPSTGASSKRSRFFAEASVFETIGSCVR